MPSVLDSYRMRVLRRTYRHRARYKSRELKNVTDRTDQIPKDGVLCFVTLRNELVRLPFFLRYYRDLGVTQFLIVDNGSTDGSLDYLQQQDDVSLWSTDKSYRRSRFGVDWLNWLLSRYGSGHWCLTVDPDEFLAYPFCDSRPLDALTDWLDAAQARSFGTLLLDLYPKGPISAQPYVAGADPLDIAPWFDPGNYIISKDKRFENLWIQGGPRARAFFADEPKKAPALNKIPLVKWRRNYCYVSSTHSLLPRGLNHVYDEWGGEMVSGVLLHTKFLSPVSGKATEEIQRGEHYAGGREYRAYADSNIGDLDLWCSWSEKYINWRQLEVLGLLSKGNWA